MPGRAHSHILFELLVGGAAGLPTQGREYGDIELSRLHALRRKCCATRACEVQVCRHEGATATVNKADAALLHGSAS